MRFAFVVLLATAVLLAGCGSHKGAVSPNAGLADFDKYGKAYYLDVAQVPIGAGEDKVKAEYGDDFEVVDSVMANGQLVEKWKFISYRATFARDPIDKFMFVTLKNHRVTNVEETLVGRTNYQQLRTTEVRSKPDPFDQLEKLKRLHDAKMITDAEYDAKRKELLDKIH